MTDTPTRCEHCGSDMPSTQTAFLHEGQVVCRECHDELNPVCPNCDEALPEKPERTRPCPHCGWTVHVIREQDVYDSTLLTKKQADRLGALRKKIGPLRRFGVTEGHFVRTMAQLRSQTGEEADEATVMRRLFYEASKRCESVVDCARLSHAEARYLHSQGVNPFHVLKRAHQQQLEAYQQQGIDGVTITGPDSCAYCRKRAGVPLAAGREAKDPELPNPDCPHRTVGSTIVIDGERTDVGVNRDAFCEARYVPYGGEAEEA